MRLKLMLFICASLLLSTATVVDAIQQTVLGVYQKNLDKYSEEGRKLDQLLDVSDSEINGLAVLAITPRKLVKINFRGKEVWLRASQLKLSLPILAECPEAAPGKSADRAVLVSSGMGAKCEK